MGNVAKRRRAREGLKVGGPRERLAEELIRREAAEHEASAQREVADGDAERERMLEATRAKVREAARDRKRLQRCREKELKRPGDTESTSLGSGSMNSETADGGVLPSLPSQSCRESRRMSSRIFAFILEQLREVNNLADKKVVMESVLERVSPFLPDCYHPPQEARARDAFIDSYRHELGLVKIANSHDLLARKSALLDAAVSSGSQKLATLSRVLGSSRKVLATAYRRRVSDSDGTSLPKLRLSRQRREGLSAEVKATVIAWWSNETKVSPNKKDVVRHRIGRKEWLPPHPTHYLCESQVYNYLLWLLYFLSIFSSSCVCLVVLLATSILCNCSDLL